MADSGWEDPLSPAVLFQVRPDSLPIEPIAAQKFAIGQQNGHPLAVLVLKLGVAVDVPNDNGIGLGSEDFRQFPEHFLAKGAALAAVNEPMGHKTQRMGWDEPEKE
jgi:hypothetical protein